MFTYSMAILMAVLVLYGGSGLNIIRFCCDDCRSAGVTAIASMSCTHHSCDEHETTPASCCEKEAATTACSHSENSSDKDCCSLERLSFDWNMHDAPKLLTDPLLTSFVLFAGDMSGIFIHIPLITEEEEAIAKGPPLTPPRDYLALLTVLLI